MFIRFPQCLPVAVCGAFVLVVSGCSADPFDPVAGNAVSPSVPPTHVVKTSSPLPAMTKVSHKGTASPAAAKAACASDGFCALPIRRPNPVTP